MVLDRHDLEEARHFAAKIVKKCGRKYFPLWQRLNEECQRQRSEEDLLEECLNSEAPTPDEQRRTEQKFRS